MYAKAKIGGFLHLCIGEEATIVGATQALRDDRLPDVDLPRARPGAGARHRARGGDGRAVRQGRRRARAGAAGRCTCSTWSAASWAATGSSAATCRWPPAWRWPPTTRGTEDATLCMFGDGATNQGTFGETMNLAALWSLPVVFMVINNQFGMGTALERHSAVTDLSQQGRGLRRARQRAATAWTCSTPTRCVSEALEKARKDREPQLVEAVTYRYRGHSMADPEEYRTKEEVEEWRARDPIVAFSDAADRGGRPRRGRRRARWTRRRSTVVDEAVEFADDSPVPRPGLAVRRHLRDRRAGARPWYSVDERSPDTHRGEQEREAGDVAHELAEAGAAHEPTTPSTRSSEERGRGEGGEAATGGERRWREMRYREALNLALREEMERRRERVPDGRGHRRVPGRVQGHRRAARGVRREARARHADLREHDRRHGRRRRDGRACGRSSS